MWDSRTPHGNFPNESSDFRIVQYTGMFPVPWKDADFDVILEERRGEMTKLVSSRKTSLTLLGKKITGLVDYEEEEKGKTTLVNDSLYNSNQCGYSY